MIARGFAGAVVLASVVVIAWAIELFAATTSMQIRTFGINPRRWDSLIGILTAPMLHLDASHLASNTGPFLVLGWLVMLRGFETFAAVSLATALVSGLGIWLIGEARSVHVGASGVIFGYLGYLLARGWFERRATSILVAGAVALFYGGMILGVLPGDPGVSWEGHLFGFIGGVAIARALAHRVTGQ